jgi:hypothetical protein
MPAARPIVGQETAIREPHVEGVKRFDKIVGSFG